MADVYRNEILLPRCSIGFEEPETKKLAERVDRVLSTLAEQLKAFEAAGSLTVGGIPAASVVAGSNAMYYQTFESNVHNAWNLRSGSTSGITYPNNGQAGGRALRTTNKAVWIASNVNLPLDPARLYRMRTRVRKISGTNRQVAVGVEGIGADGVTVVDRSGGTGTTTTQNLVALNATISSTTWTTYEGYFKGIAANGTATSPSTDASLPRVLRSATKYIRPFLALSIGGDDGVYEIDYLTLEILTETSEVNKILTEVGGRAAGTIAGTVGSTGVITANNVDSGSIATGAVGGGGDGGKNHVAAGSIQASNIKALTITADEIAAGTITAAKIAANTITAAEIAAITITASEIAANTITAGLIATDAIIARHIKAGEITTAKLSFNPGFPAIRATSAPDTRADGSALVAGDLWVKTDDGDKPYNWNGSIWVQAYTVIDGGNISTGSVTATQLTGTTLSALYADLGTITAGKIEAGSISIDAGTERILFGAATAPMTGTGIFQGKDGTDYEFRVGDPSGQYMHWDGAKLNLSPVDMYVMAHGGTDDELSRAYIDSRSYQITAPIALDVTYRDDLYLGRNTNASATGPGLLLKVTDTSAGVGYTNGSIELQPAGTGRVLVHSEIELDGALNHDGSTVGFYGNTPVSQSTGWEQFTSSATRKTGAANTISTEQLAQVVDTLIRQLVTLGLLDDVV